ncbi:MAG: hypothetical protein A2007_00610 [Verrucomicrobia bacterium GWC2_42_7]|nr:MAG: hypothetical protein A2007_00610 [Verrucomicrobia bacterium GWC2_42_7]
MLELFDSAQTYSLYLPQQNTAVSTIFSDFFGRTAFVCSGTGSPKFLEILNLYRRKVSEGAKGEAFIFIKRKVFFLSNIFPGKSS